jgi:hypothetical protein
MPLKTIRKLFERIRGGKSGHAKCGGRSHPAAPVGSRPRSSRHDLVGPSNFPLAYFNMPKSACTTIKNILYHIQHGEWNRDPLAIHRQIRFDNVILRSTEFAEYRAGSGFDRPYTVFTFVRNPAARAYSTFVEKIWATGTYSFPFARKILVNSYGYQLRPMEEGNFDPDEVRTAFKQFLRFAAINLAGGMRIPPNPHWAVQSHRLAALAPVNVVGFVGRVESFERDMSFVLESAGWTDLSIARQRFNEGPKPPFALADIMDGEMAAMLDRLYRDDFAAFDYPSPLRKKSNSQGSV